MRRTVVAALSFASALTLLGVLGPPPASGAAGVEVGRVRIAAPTGTAALLVPVHYPIEMAGRRVHLTLSLQPPDGSRPRTLAVRPLANAGALRLPERRKRFLFVHRIDLPPRWAGWMKGDAALRTTARAQLDADRDRRLELRAHKTRQQRLSRGAAGRRICSTPSKRWARPGRPLTMKLPICTDKVRWSIADGPRAGKARIRGNRLIYRPAENFRGTASITLVGRRAGAAASVTPLGALAPLQITVGSRQSPVVRALGDSVTAGFGYFEHGEPMPFEDLLECRPGATTYNDACSSNSSVRSNAAPKVAYATDYGLSNNVSWAAQWANDHGVTNYKNFAVSGSEPSDWFGQGQFAAATRQIVGEDPDYLLLTLGANPLLSNMLFGLGNIGCGVWADLFGRFQECIREEFEEIKLHDNLKTLYSTLAKETSARIFVMQYHLSTPVSALYGVEQIAVMGNMLNAEIATVAQEVDPTGERLAVVAPPHFNVGLSLGEAYPSSYKCEGRFFTSVVDGPSVQAEAAQAEMGKLHPIEFCPQPSGEAPWVINGDSGIHPSAAGYAQMASRLPAPK